jgi:CheY-like chemotaxis protein
MKQYKIIIVENDPDEQFFMKESFDTVDLFQILAQVKNGDDLFDWLEMNDELPDVILSDLNMPGKNGYDILEGIKTSPVWSHIPVIITSTSSTGSIIDKCLNAGASDYIIKPDTFIDYRSFVKRLYDVIEGKQLVK